MAVINSTLHVTGAYNQQVGISTSAILHSLFDISTKLRINLGICTKLQVPLVPISVTSAHDPVVGKEPATPGHRVSVISA